MGFNSFFDNRHRRKYEKFAKKVLALEEKFHSMTDEELKGMTEQFKTKLANNKTVDDIKIEAAAVVREAAYRVLGMRHYFVQILGGLVLLDGDVAEMSTGEGKTLVSTVPAYIRGLEGKGVHVITSNEYLAERDKEQMGQVHEFLGLTVGLNIAGLNTFEKQQAYAADITYGVGNEFGFDYLRDHLVYDTSQKVQRQLNFAIIDEVDSILIDEARTPLIIAGRTSVTKTLYHTCDNVIKALKEDEHYEIDLEYHTVSLTNDGIDKIQTILGIENLYDLKNHQINHLLKQSLRANTILRKNVDYIVAKDKIELVDANTGRVMEGRSLSDGLHQAIEAKENVTITDENKTQSSITLQNYFRKYNYLSGMSGTAKTEEAEFKKLYNMLTVQIPTNKTKKRIDKPDQIYVTKHDKYMAIVEEVVEQYESGRPILIGTTSIEQSLEIADYLDNQTQVPFQVLNAQTVEFESELIASAGKEYSVMIATNMAGRGTDIILEPRCKDELGGLLVLCAERNDSRRVDNQLIGRAGRQGDPGESKFFISLEDKLFERHADEERMEMLNKKLTQTKDSGLVTSKGPYKFIKTLQLISEGRHFSSRDYTTKLDDVLNEQRDAMYEIRESILNGENILDFGIKSFKSCVESIATEYCPPNKEAEDWDIHGLADKLKPIFNDVLVELPNQISNSKELFNKLNHLGDLYINCLNQKNRNSILEQLLKTNMLQLLDMRWAQHLDIMASLKEGIGLQSYAQQDPLRSYELEGFEQYNRTFEVIRSDIAIELAKVSKNIELDGDNIIVVGF